MLQTWPPACFSLAPCHVGQTSSQQDPHQHPLRKGGPSPLPGVPVQPRALLSPFLLKQRDALRASQPQGRSGPPLPPAPSTPSPPQRSPTPYLRSARGVYSSRSEGTEAPSSSLACSGSRREGSPATPPEPPGIPCWPAWCFCRGRPGTAAACGTGSCSWALPRTARWLARSPPALASHGGPAPAGTGGQPASGGSHLGEGQGKER